MTAYVVFGLGYGDEGKGSITDALVRHTGSKLVVRFNGGAQAAHNVCLPDGRHHMFSQFGSGTFVPGCQTYLSQHFLFNPRTFMGEGEALISKGVADAFERVFVNGSAPVTTPYHIAGNRLRELARGDGHHGSCGMGIGETVGDVKTLGQYALFVSDLPNRQVVLEKLRILRDLKLMQMSSFALTSQSMKDEYSRIQDPATIEAYADMLVSAASRINVVDENFVTDSLSAGDVVFEGAQGALLDEHYGTFPYVTRSTTVPSNALNILHSCGESDVVTIVLVRTYMTRHGAGPFVTEDRSVQYEEKHNKYSSWQEGWRQGYFDLVALDYAVRVSGGLNGVGVSHMDLLPAVIKVCVGYEGYPDGLPLPWNTLNGERVSLTVADHLGRNAERTERLFKAIPIYKEMSKEEFLGAIEKMAGPIKVTSYGPTFEAKRFTL